MVHSVGERLRVVGVRLMLAVATLASVAAVCFSAPSTAMGAENFCGVYLQPYGHNGDRCWGAGHPLLGVNLVTYERAGCVDVANSNNELLQSWTCGAAGSAPGSAVELHFSNDGIRRKGVIRNNNLSFVGFFAGAEICFTEC
jgi:hypothetical protein